MWAGNTKLTLIEDVILNGKTQLLSKKLTFDFSNPDTNGTDSISDVFNDISEDSIKRYVSNRERALDNKDALASLLNQIIKTVPDPLSQNDKDLQAFQQNVQIKKKMELAIASGDKKNTDQDYIDLVSLIKKNLTDNPDWIKFYN